MAHIKQLYVRNYVGISEMEVEPGKVTMFSGKNGTGKSSALNSILDVFGNNGEIVKILREGETDGDLVVILDDERRIERKFNSEGEDKTVIKDPLRGKIPQADTKKILKKLTDFMAMNPLRFLTADDKERAKVLLDSMPVEIDESGKVSLAKSGIETKTLSLVNDHLGWLNGKRKEVFDARRDINRTVKEKSAHASELEDTLPRKSGQEIRREYAEAEKNLADLEQLFREKKEGLASDQRLTLKRVDANLAEREKEIQDEYNEKLAELNKWKEEVTKIASDTYGESIKKANTLYIEKGKDLSDEMDPKIEAAQRLVTELRVKNESETGYAKTREIIGSLKTDLSSMREKAEAMTKQIEMIDSVKEKLLSDLPVKNVEVSDGIVHVDGRPWSDVNTARRVEIGFEIASLRMGDLRVMVIDDAEHLDDETLAEIEKQAQDRDIQLFVARVENMPFSISVN